jgi:hypothetical protein
MLLQLARQLRAGHRAPVGADQDARDSDLDLGRRGLPRTGSPVRPGCRDPTHSAGRATRAPAPAPRSGACGDGRGHGAQLGRVGDRLVAQVGLGDGTSATSGLSRPCSVRAAAFGAAQAGPHGGMRHVVGRAAGATRRLKAPSSSAPVQAAGQVHLGHADRALRACSSPSISASSVQRCSLPTASPGPVPGSCSMRTRASGCRHRARSRGSARGSVVARDRRQRLASSGVRRTGSSSAFV